MKAWIIVIQLFLFSTINYASDLTQKLQHDLDNSLKDKSAPGAVMLVATKTVGPLLFASGLSDITLHKAMRVDDTFRVASISKTFLAVAILILVDEKKISLDALAKSYLPAGVDINRIPNGNTVTVRELLQMRSGIPNYYLGDNYNDLFRDNANHIVTPIEAVQTIYDTKPLFPNGKKYNYSNTNYVMLQLILEQVTHKTFAQTIQDKLINKLALTHTYVTDEKDFSNLDDHRLTTHGYTFNTKNQFIDVTRKYDGNGLGDGAIVTNITDLYHFLKALLQEKTVLSPESLQAMLHFIDDYGLGISVERVSGYDYYTHNGTAAGYSGQYYVDNDFNWVIILTNSDETDFIVDLSDKAYQSL